MKGLRVKVPCRTDAGAYSTGRCVSEPFPVMRLEDGETDFVVLVQVGKLFKRYCTDELECIHNEY
jgi:hypothetical protein